MFQWLKNKLAWLCGADGWFSLRLRSACDGEKNHLQVLLEQNSRNLDVARDRLEDCEKHISQLLAAPAISSESEIKITDSIIDADRYMVSISCSGREMYGHSVKRLREMLHRKIDHELPSAIAKHQGRHGKRAQ